MAEYMLMDTEVLDAVAEIANMILGNVKTALKKSLGTMGMSIPAAICAGSTAVVTAGARGGGVIVRASIA